jgi:hypothetical protein
MFSSDPQPDSNAATNATTNMPVPNRLRMMDRRYGLGAFATSSHWGDVLMQQQAELRGPRGRLTG